MAPHVAGSSAAPAQEAMDRHCRLFVTAEEHTRSAPVRSCSCARRGGLVRLCAAVTCPSEGGETRWLAVPCRGSDAALGTEKTMAPGGCTTAPGGCMPPDASLDGCVAAFPIRLFCSGSSTSGVPGAMDDGTSSMRFDGGTPVGCQIGCCMGSCMGSCCNGVARSGRGCSTEARRSESAVMAASRAPSLSLAFSWDRRADMHEEAPICWFQIHALATKLLTTIRLAVK